MYSPAEAEFKIIWDDESGKDHEWKKFWIFMNKL
jgi:hypothetical protein